MSVDLDDLRSIPELRAQLGENKRRLTQLDADFAGLPFDDTARSEFAGRTEQNIEIEKRVRELEARHRQLGEQIRGGHFERELTEQDRRSSPAPWSRGGVDPSDPRLRAGLDSALRAIDRCTGLEGFSDRSAQRVEKMLRSTDRDGLEARYIAAVSDPAYATAFTKALPDPSRGHLSFTPEEAEAMRRVRAVEMERALGDATGSAGGFGLPITIDPTIILTNVGALNPLREVSRVEQISTYTWRGVSSDGVVAGFGAEATEASDNSPTLVQPTITTAKGFAFVPFSIEVGQDYPMLQTELVQLLADAKNVLEATKFLLGTGSNEPAGILNIGGTGGLVQANSRVLTATIATFAYADLWTLKQAIPVRYLADSTVVMHPNTLDSTYQLSPTGSTTLAWLMPQGRNGPLTGLPTGQLSSLATGTTTGFKTAVAGNFKKGFLITDRLGMAVEVAPMLFGPANRFPTGQRGLYMYYRTGSTTIGASSAAGCPLRYLEIK